MSWRRVLLLSLAFVLVLCCVTWVVLQRSGAATVVVQRRLAELLAAEARIEATELDLANGRLIVRGLQVLDPVRPGTALLTAAHIDIDVAVDPFGNFVNAHRVAIRGLVLDLGARLPSAAQLFRGSASGGGGGAIPGLEITEARLRATMADGKSPFEIVDVELSALPTEGSPDLLTLSGSGRVDGIETAVTLGGTIDSNSGAIDLTVKFAARAIDAVVARWLDDRLAIDRRDIVIGGQLSELTVTLATVANGSGDRLRAEARGTVKNASFTAPRLPRQVRDATVTFVASNDRGGDLVVRVEQHNAKGKIDITGEVTQLQSEPSYALRAKGEALTIDADMVDALRLVPIGRHVTDALRPTAGRADIDLYLRNPHLRTGLAEFDMTLRDVAMSYIGFRYRADPSARRIGFPLPLVGAQGRVRLRDDVVLLEQLSAQIAPAVGGGDVTLSGRIDTLAAAGEQTTIDITTTNVAFTPQLRGCCSALLDDDGDLYDRLAPSGRANVAVQIRPLSVLPAGWAVTIEPQGSTVTLNGFPYRLENLRGTIQVSWPSVEFDLEGNHGSGSVHVNGLIPIDDSAEGPGFEVAMRLTDLDIDDELRRAVTVRAPAIDGHWIGCAPTGKCSGFVRAWRTGADSPFELDLRVDLTGVDLQLPTRPWRARELSGQLLITGTGDTVRIDFDALRGRLEHGSGQSARLAMLGTVIAGATTSSDLSLVVRGLELDAQLGRTLEELDALGTGVWDYLRPSGAVDLVCRHRLLEDGSDDLDLVVHLLDVGSDAPILPRAARKMTGELHIAAGRLTFKELRAELGGKLVRCLDGAIQSGSIADDRTRIAFRVAANAFPLDRGFANLFSGPLHQAIADRGLSGVTDIDELSLAFAVPTSDSSLAFETVLSGTLRLHGVGMKLGRGGDGIRIDDINGTITLDESRVGEAGGGLSGTWRGGSLTIFGQPFLAIGARFVTDADHMSLEQLAARFHGGTIATGTGAAPAVHFLLPNAAAPEGRLAANLTYESVDIHAFLKQAGQPNPPYRGSARGAFRLTRLDGQDIAAAAATGSCVITRGDLGIVPLFTAIYRQLPAAVRPRFDGLDLAFELADQRVTLQRLNLSSKILGAEGTGILNLDGYLGVRLTLKNLLGNSADPVFMPLIDFFAKRLVRFHLYGHLRDLKAEQRWITEGSPRRPPIPPLPPIMTRRARADY